jgi:hypothetical protein
MYEEGEHGMQKMKLLVRTKYFEATIVFCHETSWSRLSLAAIGGVFLTRVVRVVEKPGIANREDSIKPEEEQGSQSLRSVHVCSRVEATMLDVCFNANVYVRVFDIIVAFVATRDKRVMFLIFIVISGSNLPILHNATAKDFCEKRTSNIYRCV